MISTKVMFPGYKQKEPAPGNNNNNKKDVLESYQRTPQVCGSKLGKEIKGS